MNAEYDYALDGYKMGECVSDWDMLYNGNPACTQSDDEPASDELVETVETLVEPVEDVIPETNATDTCCKEEVIEEPKSEPVAIETTVKTVKIKKSEPVVEEPMAENTCDSLNECNCNCENVAENTISAEDLEKVLGLAEEAEAAENPEPEVKNIADVINDIKKNKPGKKHTPKN